MLHVDELCVRLWARIIADTAQMLDIHAARAGPIALTLCDPFGGFQHIRSWRPMSIVKAVGVLVVPVHLWLGMQPVHRNGALWSVPENSELGYGDTWRDGRSPQLSAHSLATFHGHSHPAAQRAWTVVRPR